MTRTSLDHHNCSFARTIDIIGDRWSLMILRDAFYGISRFADFKQRLGVTQAVLSARLSHLVDHNLLNKRPIDSGSAREEYRLTDQGRDLITVIIALMQWGDRHIHDSEGPPIELFNKVTGEPIDTLKIQSDGVSVKPRELGFKLGPGANKRTRIEFESIKSEVP